MPSIVSAQVISAVLSHLMVIQHPAQAILRPCCLMASELWAPMSQWKGHLKMMERPDSCPWPRLQQSKGCGKK